MQRTCKELAGIEQHHKKNEIILSKPRSTPYFGKKYRRKKITETEEIHLNPESKRLERNQQNQSVLCPRPGTDRADFKIYGIKRRKIRRMY